MKTASDIIQAAGGRDAVAKAIGVIPRYITDRAREGELPASWFDSLEKMTKRKLPRELFSFKGIQE